MYGGERERERDKVHLGNCTLRIRRVKVPLANPGYFILVLDTAIHSETVFHLGILVSISIHSFLLHLLSLRYQLLSFSIQKLCHTIK